MTTTILGAVVGIAVVLGAFFLGRSSGFRVGLNTAQASLGTALEKIESNAQAAAAAAFQGVTREVREGSESALRSALNAVGEQAKAALEGAAQERKKILEDAARARAFELEQAEKARRMDTQRAVDVLKNQVTEPVTTALNRLHQITSEAAAKNARAYGETMEAARRIGEQVETVQRSALTLRDALKGDRQARGRWGEIQLKRLVEMAGLKERVDFSTQVHHAREDQAAARPDMVLHLPDGKGLAVDSKAPMDTYLEAMNEDNNDRRAELMQRHAEILRGHVRGLSKRRYQDVMGGPGFVVAFLPLESLLVDALRADPGFLEFAAEHKIVVTTPATLMAILYSVASMWQQAESTKNADAIKKEAEKVAARFDTFLAKYDGIGKGLARALRSYNEGAASMESRLFPSLRRMAELRGVDEHGAGTEPAQVDGTPRPAPPLLQAAQPKPDPANDVEPTPAAPHGGRGPGLLELPDIAPRREAAE